MGEHEGPGLPAGEGVRRVHRVRVQGVRQEVLLRQGQGWQAGEGWGAHAMWEDEPWDDSTMFLCSMPTRAELSHPPSKLTRRGRVSRGVPWQDGGGASRSRRGSRAEARPPVRTASPASSRRMWSTYPGLESDGTPYQMSDRVHDQRWPREAGQEVEEEEDE